MQFNDDDCDGYDDAADYDCDNDVYAAADGLSFYCLKSVQPYQFLLGQKLSSRWSGVHIPEFSLLRWYDTWEK